MRSTNYIEAAERLARERYDGHLTLMRFTNGWKAVFGTPDIHGAERAEVGALATADSADDACRDLVERVSFGGWSQ